MVELTDIGTRFAPRKKYRLLDSDEVTLELARI